MDPAMPTRITRVPVAGMTCAACTQRVGAALRRIPGVESVEVSLPAGAATLTGSRVPSDEELSRELASAGYGLGRTRWLSGDTEVWGTFAVALVVVTALILAALRLGIADIPAQLSSPGSGGLMLVGLVGLAAGVSTCMALVGGLVLSISAAHAASTPPDAERSFAGRMRPHLVFNAGRITGFVLLGALLGTIGGAFSVPTRLMGVVILAVAAVMAILGIRLTEVSPRVAAWAPHLPTRLATLVSRGARDTQYTDLRAAALGAATFLLPCGFTQAVQLYALTTGSAVSAGLIMGVFALGTRCRSAGSSPAIDCQPPLRQLREAYREGEEVASMDGSQPGQGIDPKMIRDHGGDLETLDREIRDIESEALEMQARLVKRSSLPAPRKPHRGWRRGT